MLSSTKIKWIRSLHQKKYRDLEKLFLVEGEKLNQELFSSDFKIISSFATEDWLSKHREIEFPIPIEPISNSNLQRISSLKTPNKILSVVEKIEWNKNKLIPKEGQLSLALDQIADPGNMGTIIRTANWFGIKNVICSLDSVDIYNPKVVQATMGSIFHTPITYTNLEGFLTKHRDLLIHGAFLGGESILSQPIEKPSILVLGNESRGISDKLIELISKKVSIPSFGNAESLNVSVACGIFCAAYKKTI